MGLMQFLLIAIVVVVVCAAAVWVMTELAPSHPIIIDRMIWVLAVIIVGLILVKATGLLSHDVLIPKLRW